MTGPGPYPGQEPGETPLASEAEVRTEEAKLKRFSPLRDLPPFFLAGLILWYVLRGRDWAAIEQAMSQCRLPLFLAGAGLYTLGYFLVNALSFHLLYHWFLVRVRLREMVTVFGASLIAQALITALGRIIILVYMIRKKRLKISATLGLGIFRGFCAMWAVTIALTMALILKPDTMAAVYWWYGSLVPLMLVWTWYFPLGGGKKHLSRLYYSQFALSIRVARPGHYLKFIALRLGWPALQILSHSLALQAMGIQAPLGSVIVIVILMTLTTNMPISALGFGAPNWAATYFSPYAPAPETAIAYGFLFQSCFLIGRCLIGLVFAVPFWSGAIRPARDLEHVRHRGEEEHFHRGQDEQGQAREG